MKAKDGLRDIISMTLLALMTVLVIFASVCTSSKKKSSDGVQDIERDKVDCTILPSPRGKNPFVGKSFEIRTESTLNRFSFAEDGMLYVTEPCTLDKRLTVTLESICDYTWNTDVQELYVKPVAYKINEDYSANSNQIKNHFVNKALEVLDNLPYPWYSDEDRETAALFLHEYFSVLFEKKLFEVEQFNYDVQDNGLMLEKIKDDLFENTVTFSYENEDTETTVKLSYCEAVLSFIDPAKKETVYYAGIPVYDFDSKIVKSNLCRLNYDDSIQIETGNIVRLEILPSEKDDANGMFSVKVKILEIPEETGIKEGETIETLVPYVNELMWYNISY